MRLCARDYRTAQSLDIVCEHGKIARVDAAPTDDTTAPWVAPAFCDVQINGCDGISFNSETLTREEIRHVVETCRRHGIAQLCPTLVTGSFEALMHGFRTIREACAEDPDLAQAIVGIHLEGPYISPEDGPRGAHPKAHVRPPSWDEFHRFQAEAAHGMIRMLTLAPETRGALPFIEKVAQTGVVVALGHTAATGACIRDAIKAGARISTHLGNGSHAVLPRHDNYIWEQMAADELWASIICDGHHLPPAVVRCILRVKTPGRTILTCDASSLAGLPPGRYQAWGQDLEVLAEGKIRVADTHYLAGSWSFTDSCLDKVIRFAGVSLRDAVDMAGARPRQLLGLPPRRLEAGQPAELVLFDWEQGGDFRVRDVL